MGEERSIQNRQSCKNKERGKCELNVKRFVPRWVVCMNGAERLAIIRVIGELQMLSASESIEFHPSLTAGVRVRHRRWMLGMSRQALATAVGASEDLIEAYERGERQIGGMLFDSMCGALSVSPRSIISKSSEPKTPHLPSLATS